MAALLLASAALVAYTGPAACARCHPAIAESWSKTAMARSFRSVQPDIRLPEFDGRAFFNSASRQTFTPAFEAGEHFVSREQAVPGFSAFRVTADYVLGSGEHARSWLHRTPENTLVEFPVTWYSRRGGYWDMSPGYDRPGHQGFSREIDYRCMFCHNAYPSDSTLAAGGRDGGTVFPGKLPEGIDCERCHGPGERHVNEPRSGTIVNPARLPAERAMEVCLQCHLETTSGDLPGDQLRPGRGVFSYGPGEPLGDYRIYFDHAPEAGRGEKYEIVGAAYRLRQAACFRAQPEKLVCTACHQVHRAETRKETAARTRIVCRSCHISSTHFPEEDCVACHMPMRETEDVPHVEMTDHRISRVPGTTRAVPRNDDLPYGGARVVYYPTGVTTPGVTARGVTAPGVTAPGVTAPGGKEEGPGVPAPPVLRNYTSRGQALLGKGDVRGAVEALRGAVRERPEIADIRVNYGAALIAAGDYEGARVQLEEAIRTGASVETARGVWLMARAAGNNVETANARYAASLKSQMLGAHTNLAVALDLLGRKADAIREFRLALECAPESEEARANLRRALPGR